MQFVKIKLERLTEITNKSLEYLTNSKSNSLK